MSEVTEEMKRAGLVVLLDWYAGDDSITEDLAIDVFLAMKAKEPKQDPTQLQEAMDEQA